MTEPHHPLPEVLETLYDDSDLKRAHESEQPIIENTGNPVYSKTILAMAKKMRKGSIADNNKRSKKIVKKLLKDRKKIERENKKATKVVKPPAKCAQRSISDFGGK